VNKYYEVIATIDGCDEVMFGSYVRSECEYEKRAESPCWREEGYRNIRIEMRMVAEAPDPQVYLGIGAGPPPKEFLETIKNLYNH